MLAAAAAGAQSISGRVLDRATGEALGGVVVSGFDSSGAKVVARAITDRINGYRLAALPGMASLQFRRIGYAPVTARLRDSVDGRIDVRMARLPTQLPPMKALATATCDRRADRDQALALWQEARSGLLASIVARESKLGEVSILAYRYAAEGDREHPRTVQRVEVRSASHAFVAGGDPDTLARRGYVEYENRMATLLGPDDVVLFDDTFFSTHCFSLEKPVAGDDSTLGLHFRPGNGRRLPDVEGTLWLRKDPLDLKSVDFRYVNLPLSLRRGPPGGSIEFRQMPNGITMIHHWHIRGAAQGSTSTVTGAMIEMMQWPDAPPYVATLGAVSGTAKEKRTGRLIRGRQVRLNGTPFTAVTDSSGAFRIFDVLPGVYAMDVGDPILDFLQLTSRDPRGFRVNAGENDIGTVEVESGADLVKRACDDDFREQVKIPAGLGNAAVFGAVMDTLANPVRATFWVEVRPASLVAGSPPFAIKGKTDGFGRFRICGLPIDGTVTITTDEIGSMTGRAELVFDPVTAQAAPYQLAGVVIRPKPPAGPELLLKPPRH
jgi:hypothetical protein